MSRPHPPLPQAADNLADLLVEHGWQIERANPEISGGHHGGAFYQHEILAARNGLVLQVHWERDLDNSQPYWERPYPVGRWAFERTYVRPQRPSESGHVWYDRHYWHVLGLDTLAGTRRYLMQDPEVQRRMWDERDARLKED